LQRSVTSREFSFWRAFEEVEGPIGYGPLVKLAAWLGWTQCDGRKIEPAGVLELMEGFLADPLEAGGDDDGDDGEPLTDEESIEQRRRMLETKLMQIFKHPELKAKEDSD
jgi:hypothetical protein